MVKCQSQRALGRREGLCGRCYLSTSIIPSSFLMKPQLCSSVVLCLPFSSADLLSTSLFPTLGSTKEAVLYGLHQSSGCVWLRGDGSRKSKGNRTIRSGYQFLLLPHGGPAVPPAIRQPSLQSFLCLWLPSLLLLSFAQGSRLNSSLLPVS